MSGVAEGFRPQGLVVLLIVVFLADFHRVDAAWSSGSTTTSRRHHHWHAKSFRARISDSDEILSGSNLLSTRATAASCYFHSSSRTIRRAVPGADIELTSTDETTSSDAATAATKAAGAAVVGETPVSASDVPLTRGKVNEIDFTIAPADVSLSRAYGTLASSSATTTTASTSTTTTTTASSAEEDDIENKKTTTAPVLSLTRALNNASNRAIRRIMLARSWPSAKALNLSLRRVAELERQAAAETATTAAMKKSTDPTSTNPNTPKCPVPRPILNVLMRRREQVSTASSSKSSSSSSSSSSTTTPPIPRKARTDDEYVADQLLSFQNLYGELPGYSFAEAYLESVLSLATCGIESPRVQEVLESAIYDESYKRILSVLKSVGVVFETDPATGRRAIAKKLIDQDICLSIMDKIRAKQPIVEPLKPTVKVEKVMKEEKEEEAPPQATEDKGEQVDDAKEKNEAESTKRPKIEIEVEDGVSILKPKFKLFQKEAKAEERSETKEDPTSASEAESTTNSSTTSTADDLTGEDLGGVLLSAREPSMTGQLNVLSNIVQRALLFGGDEELLVLSETLNADRAAFCERWYPETGGPTDPVMDEERPGVQFVNCLVQLLRQCYQQGVVTDLTPPLPLSTSFANAYERLVCAGVELGSGYLKPTPGDMMTTPSINVISTLPKPRTAQEELGRFAVWESNFRRSSNEETPPESSAATARATTTESAYPSDLEGTWQVQDEIGSETIGQSTIVFKPKGTVEVPPPLEGLRWRLDPGPTHLDTITFQVLSSDGTILQYRGFLDRGARLEARFSKRPLRIRGSVMFQMRDGSIDYYKDMLPINYKQGTTKFVMTSTTANT